MALRSCIKRSTGSQLIVERRIAMKSRRLYSNPSESFAPFLVEVWVNELGEVDTRFVRILIPCSIKQLHSNEAER